MPDYHDLYQHYLNQGELRLPYCQSCRQFIFYPRHFCPYCWQEEMEWQPVQGRGTVYSYTIVNVSSLPEFAAETPYILAIIELTEGARMPGNIINCTPEKVKVGMPVQIEIMQKQDRMVVAFKPDDTI